MQLGRFSDPKVDLLFKENIPQVAENRNNQQLAQKEDEICHLKITKICI